MIVCRLIEVLQEMGRSDWQLAVMIVCRLIEVLQEMGRSDWQLAVMILCRLIEVLQEMGRSDWQLAAMVCKTLWNYSCKITSADACFGSSAVSELVDILTELLGECNVIVKMTL